VKIILRSDVRDLGRIGDLVEVKDGYARNFLLPRNLAVAATPGNIKDYQKKIASAKEREARERAAAIAMADRIRDKRVTIIHRAAEGTNRLHGSVTSQEVATALSELVGETIDRRDIDIRHPIRSLGEYQVNVKLVRGLTIPVKVLVAETEPVDEPPVAEAEAAEGAEGAEASEAPDTEEEAAE